MTTGRVSQATLRVRLIEQAARMTGEDGWGSVTMGRLADAVGVSRQTVYNEIGGKPALAEAMVMYELDAFLRQVDEQFAAHDDLIDAVRGACRAVLELGRNNPLLRAILSSSHGGGGDLLPLLTTDAEVLIDTAVAVVRGHVEPYRLPLPSERLDAVVEMVVRLVLSHVTRPARTPEKVADEIAWLASRVLAER